MNIKSLITVSVGIIITAGSAINVIYQSLKRDKSNNISHDTESKMIKNMKWIILILIILITIDSFILLISLADR